MGRTALGFSIVIDPNFCSVYSGSVYQYLAGALNRPGFRGGLNS